MELWLEIVLLEMLCRWDSYPLDMKDWYWLRLISPSSCSVLIVWDCGVTFLLLECFKNVHPKVCNHGEGPWLKAATTAFTFKALC